MIYTPLIFYFKTAQLKYYIIETKAYFISFEIMNIL